MEIKDLFYNIPARLKFLKNPNTEFSYIQELVQSIAISHPQTAFELKKNGKTVLKTSGNNELKHALKELFSNNVTDNLKEVLKTDQLSGLKISGYVSTPDFTRSSKKDYHIYINSRTVKCPIFMKAIDTAYKNLISNGKYPFVVLNLELPPSDVDVNVHPTKKEVRYKNTNQIFNFIMTGIHGGLANYTEPEPSYNIQQKAAEKTNIIELKPQQNTFDIVYNKTDDEMVVEEKTFDMIQDKTPQVVSETEQKQIFKPVEKAPEPEENIVGQYKNTYIIVEKEDGMEIIDQHIAEERYLSLIHI